MQRIALWMENCQYLAYVGVRATNDCEIGLYLWRYCFFEQDVPLFIIKPGILFISFFNYFKNMLKFDISNKDVHNHHKNLNDHYTRQLRITNPLSCNMYCNAWETVYRAL